MSAEAGRRFARTREMGLGAGRRRPREGSFFSRARCMGRHVSRAACAEGHTPWVFARTRAHGGPHPRGRRAGNARGAHARVSARVWGGRREGRSWKDGTQPSMMWVILGTQEQRTPHHGHSWAQGLRGWRHTRHGALCAPPVEGAARGLRTARRESRSAPEDGELLEDLFLFLEHAGSRSHAPGACGHRPKQANEQQSQKDMVNDPSHLLHDCVNERAECPNISELLLDSPVCHFPWRMP